MDELLIIAGLVLIAGTMFDALWTTLGFAGGGPLTRRLALGIWAIPWAVIVGARGARMGCSGAAER